MSLFFSHACLLLVSKKNFSPCSDRDPTGSLLIKSSRVASRPLLIAYPTTTPVHLCLSETPLLLLQTVGRNAEQPKLKLPQTPGPSPLQSFLSPSDDARPSRVTLLLRVLEVYEKVFFTRAREIRYIPLYHQVVFFLK